MCVGTSLRLADLKLELPQVFKNNFMKKIFAFVAIAFLFVACKEQTPAGLVLKDPIVIPGGATPRDTTYVAPIEVPQKKSLLVEESTGNKCANCPFGKTQIFQAKQANPGRIKVMALHFTGLEVDQPSEKYYTLQNQHVRDLISYLDGDQGQPCAAFNRVPVGGKYFLVRGAGGNWATPITNELAKTTPVNLHLTSRYDTTYDEVVLDAKVAFTEAVTGKLSLSAFVLEDGLIGSQDSSAFPTVVKLEDYEFNEVMRKAITPVFGTQILSTLTAIEAGRVFERRLVFKPDAIWNKDKCKIMVFVHRAETVDKTVLQVEEVEMK